MIIQKLLFWNALLKLINNYSNNNEPSSFLSSPRELRRPPTCLRRCAAGLQTINRHPIGANLYSNQKYLNELPWFTNLEQFQLSVFPNSSEESVTRAALMLTPSEKNYGQIEELVLSMAIIYAVKKFYKYIPRSHFTLSTDHNPLMPVFGSKNYISIFNESSDTTKLRN